MAEFCIGLHPILMKADAMAFRRYLAEWEDVIGDTAELGATSEDQLRRTMIALLRRPQQFNLPPWPEVAPRANGDAEGDEGQGAGALPRRLPDVVPHSVTAWPAPAAPEAAGAPAESSVVPERDAVAERAPPTAASGGAGVYQLDMVTGELVAIPERALAEPNAAPYASESESKPALRPRRRRRSTSGLRQLTFWPAADSG